jgi:hypothetical protein
MCTCLVSALGTGACLVLALVFGLNAALFTGVLVFALLGLIGLSVGLP